MITAVLSAADPWGRVEKKRRNLLKRLASNLRQLQNMEGAAGLRFGFLVSPPAGMPIIIRPDGVHVVANESLLSEVHCPCMLLPGAHDLHPL